MLIQFLLYLRKRLKVILISVARETNNTLT